MYFGSLDLLLSVDTAFTHQNDVVTESSIPDATGTALEKLVRQIQKLRHGIEVPVKIILAPHEGYVCRSDILSLRIGQSEFVESVVSFSSWNEHLPASSTLNQGSLLTLLLSSPGAVFAKQSKASHYETFFTLQKDLEMRLSFDWLLPSKPGVRRVAIVAGRNMREPKRGVYWSQSFFEAALALGISPVVLDTPGHWMAGEEYAHLRGEFVPIHLDPTNVEGLPQRIADALKDKPLDGITTFTDEYVVATAEAAELLKLPTEPAQVMRQAHFKQEMREVLNDKAVTLRNEKQLDDPELADVLSSLEYPLIIKPCRGLLSRGVMKIIDDKGLRQAIRTLEEEGLAEHGVLLEPYIDGPELDGNFVLLDGKVLFLEVCDNFPCLGDAREATLASDFSETVLISSSKLPPEEVEIIRSGLQHSLLNLGFRSGVFHVEARMKNSSMQYQDVLGDGIHDLVVRDINSSSANGAIRKPDVYLIEVNARPPGAGGNWATLHTYGVDMGALQLLRAIDDKERFKVLSKPYAYEDPHPGNGGGAQWWTAHCMIPVHGEKIFVPEDFFEKVYQIIPEIIPHVTRSELYADPGKVAPRSGGVGWVGYVLLYSRTSRRHAVKMYHRLVEAAEQVLNEASQGL